MNVEEIFFKEIRKPKVLLLFRKILKQIKIFKDIDNYIYDFMKIYLPHIFKEKSKLFNISEINNEIKKTEIFLEDLIKFVENQQTSENIEEIIHFTYGQRGPRRIIFERAYQQYLKDYGTTHRCYMKPDFLRLNKVPLPLSFYKHIEELLTQTKEIQNNKKLFNIYVNLI